MIKNNYDYVIIGNSAAGISAINKLWQLDPSASVVCISQEKERPYNKCFLADYLSGEKKEAQIFTKLFHKSVDFLFENRVVAIDRDKKRVNLSDNAPIEYGKLLVATGSSPAVPRISGIDGPGVFTFHTLNDTNKILSFVSQNDFSRVTIIGAGLSGLEAADALRSQNLEVTLVERSVQVLPSQIDYEAARFIQDRMKIQGISFLPNREVAEIVRKDGVIQAVKLSNGSSLATDIVICATGLHPNSELGRAANLQMIENSLWVDQNMQTSDEHIYAAGDVIAVEDQLTRKPVRSCTWPDAMHQGLTAAHAMSSNPKPYPGVIVVASSAFFGVKFAVSGYRPNLPKGERYTTVSCKGSDDEYCKMFVKDGIPVGFIMIGKTLPQLGSIRRSVMLRQPYAIHPPYRLA